MLNEGDESVNKTADYFFEKMKKGYNKYINSKKQKLLKRKDLIKYLESFNRIDNNNYINKINNNKNKEHSLNSKPKTIFENSKDRIPENSQKNFTSINYNSDNYINKEPNLNLTLNSNFIDKEKFSNKINLIKSFNNNLSESRKNEILYDSFFNSKNSNSNKNHKGNSVISGNILNLTQSKIPSSLNAYKSLNLLNLNDNKFRPIFTKRKNKISIKKLILSPFKYSDNYKENRFLTKIMTNPNLKLLYGTNEKRAKNNIKSKSISIKKKLSLKNYQYNLIKNTLLPLDISEKKKLLKSFGKINSKCEYNRKMDLVTYLDEIQRKEKELIESHNEIENIYNSNIQRIGFTPSGKRKIHIGKMKFKDIFKTNKKSYKDKYKDLI